MEKVYLLPNIKKDPSLILTARVGEELRKQGIEAYLCEQYRDKISGSFCFSDTLNAVDCLIVIGGDGTVIDAVPQALLYDLPILGVNLGKLGYLTELDPDGLDQLSRLKKGDFSYEEKMLLEVRDKSGNISDRLALNEVLFVRRDRKLATVRVRIDDGDSMQYRADGVVLTTPVGSTGYALSAGGPILSHDVRCLSLMPICPHSFFNRAVLLGDDVAVEFENASDADMLILMDGRELMTLRTGERVVVRRSTRTVRTVSLSKSRMLSTLIEKMKKIEMI